MVHQNLMEKLSTGRFAISGQNWQTDCLQRQGILEGAFAESEKKVGQTCEDSVVSLFHQTRKLFWLVENWKWKQRSESCRSERGDRTSYRQLVVSVPVCSKTARRKEVKFSSSPVFHLFLHFEINVILVQNGVRKSQKRAHWTRKRVVRNTGLFLWTKYRIWNIKFFIFYFIFLRSAMAGRVVKFGYAPPILQITVAKEGI